VHTQLLTHLPPQYSKISPSTLPSTNQNQVQK
jgi:hypothetical protein